MRRLITLMLVLALAAAGPVLAKDRAAVPEKAESCGLKGTWYGSNNHGNDLVVTVTRTGKGTYSVVFDSGASFVEGATGGTDRRGELVRLGGKKYRMTVMAYFPLQEGFGIPMAMGYCTATSKKVGCDFLQGRGSCTFVGFFHGQDPFTEGIPLAEPSRLKNVFRRMPAGVTETE